VVETRDRRSGFALVGGFKARHLFERLYLGADHALAHRFSFHRTLSADDYRSLSQRHGMVVFCGNSAPPALAADLLHFPVLVDMEMPVPVILEGPGARWTDSAKNNIRRIRRAGFTCDLQQHRRYVREFYSQMFRPSMAIRHGAEAYLSRRRDLEGLLTAAGGEMMRVMQNGRWVAASVNQSSAEGYRLCKLGWINGDAELLRAGVVSAIYWFNIQRAASLGSSRILFGSVVPCLEDGLLRHKAFWGAGLSPMGRDFGSFRLLLSPPHDDCLRFLKKHSLITRGANGDHVIVSGGTPATVPMAQSVLVTISRWYQWRDAPVPPGVDAEDVPAALRPWLMPIPMVAAPVTPTPSRRPCPQPQ
jgi:hypothetical protein